VSHPLSSEQSWQTKPTDRFVLKWIKVTLSARITPHLVEIKGLRPWMITLCSMIVGMAAGAIFGAGWGWTAGVLAAVSQVLDGVDGQFARLTGQQSDAGAFLDSVLDRYTDGALVIGLTVFVYTSGELSPWTASIVGTMALIGSGLISYSTARAETLGINLGRPTLASKGTRTTAMIAAGLLSPLSSVFPVLALLYLALHTNAEVLYRILRAFRQAPM
jgi:phosphatidylglycerophosphate synthase